MTDRTMSEQARAFAAFAEGRAPFRALAPAHFQLLTDHAEARTATAGDVLFEISDPVDGLYVITAGNIQMFSEEGETLSDMHAGDMFGHRAMLRDGRAILRVVAKSASTFVVIPADAHRKVMASDAVYASFFKRQFNAPAAAGSGSGSRNLFGQRLGDVMTPGPVTLPVTASVRDAANVMWQKHISCVLVIHANGTLAGIVTSGDLVGKVIAAGSASDLPLHAVMTADPVSSTADAMMLDAIVVMTSKRIAHLPVTDKAGMPVGIVTQTDLVRLNSNSMIYMINDIARQDTFEGLAGVVSRNARMLVELVGSGMEGHQVGRVMTGVTDALTKRLVTLAINQLGPAPVDWLWLACGSQGRMEQTGVSDQDNCLFIADDYDEAVHGAWFADFAKFVSDGLAAAGYFYCPGDMMATNPKWRQPVRVWRQYFHAWIDKADPMAQMLASVMFDLRPIIGHTELFTELNRETLEKASRNSIFRGHMIANSLKHTPPLGLFGGLTYVRGSEHKNAIDLKHSGVVPITDLGRVYALQGRIEEVNTRDRLLAATGIQGILSKTGGSDLIDAYDLIVELRLRHQTSQIRAGIKPDNFMVPDTLSALERNHLKDAFAVVKALQSSVSKGQVPG